MVMLWLWFIALLVVLVVLLVALVCLCIAALTGAPYVPVQPSVAKRMAELAEVRPGELAIDLGSGDGRIVIELAKRGAAAEGYEIQPWLVWWSKWRTRRAGVADRVSLRRANLWSVDCSRAKAVTLYAFPSMMARLEQKLLAELPVGARVVSLSFVFPTWPPLYDDGKIRVYQVSAKDLS